MKKLISAAFTVVVVLGGIMFGINANASADGWQNHPNNFNKKVTNLQIAANDTGKMLNWGGALSRVEEKNRDKWGFNDNRNYSVNNGNLLKNDYELSQAYKYDVNSLGANDLHGCQSKYLPQKCSPANLFRDNTRDLATDGVQYLEANNGARIAFINFCDEAMWNLKPVQGCYFDGENLNQYTENFNRAYNKIMNENWGREIYIVTLIHTSNKELQDRMAWLARSHSNVNAVINSENVMGYPNVWEEHSENNAYHPNNKVLQSCGSNGLELQCIQDLNGKFIDTWNYQF